MSENANQPESEILLTWEDEHLQIAPGNSKTSRFTVTNQGSGEDFFEFSFKGVPVSWIAVDRPVIRLQAGEKVDVGVTITVPEPPLSRVGSYRLMILLTSQVHPGVTKNITTELIVATFESKGRIGMLLESTRFSVAPGGAITIPIVLQNRGLIPDTFRLGVEGIPTAWITVEAAQVRLEVGEQKEIEMTIRPPRSAESAAGRTRFTIKIQSLSASEQTATAECTLTIAAFSEFQTLLQPNDITEGQSARLQVMNNGNTPEVFSMEWMSQEDKLIFERVQRETVPTSNGGNQTKESYFEFLGQQSLRVGPGKAEALEFRARPRSRPIAGSGYRISYTVSVQSGSKQVTRHEGAVTGNALVPNWAWIVLGVFLVLILCMVVGLFRVQQNQAASATQTVQAGISMVVQTTQTAQAALTQVAGATLTVSFNQTQAVITGAEDSDGDGLVRDEEIKFGTDPNNSDTDKDELIDGDEVKSRGTNPLNPDTDADGLTDGEEVLRRGTNPVNPDTDSDGVIDGEEVKRGTDPRHFDSDRDGLADGDEIRLGTNPLNPDTDNDLLPDGKESPPCPDPLKPDTDGDGILDGKDQNACDGQNPSLTQTALALIPTKTSTPTLVPPTSIPPTSVPPTPTSTVTPTATPTTAAPKPPSLPGSILFDSNRDGNQEIYALNTSTLVLTRLTNNPASNSQAVLAPDSQRVISVTNQDNNNEIYLSGMDKRAPVNLTNNPADDQQSAWSPDGQWVAFTSNRDNNQEIYIMRADGSELRNLTNNPASDSSPTWYVAQGLGGSQQLIAFTTNRDSNQEIYVTTIDGTMVNNLTNNPANDYTPCGSTFSQLITFVSERDGNPEIYVMTMAGTNPTNISHSGARDMHPSFNSTGDWVAFSTDRDGNLEIYITRVNGGEAYNLTRHPAQDSNPAWR